MLVITLVHMSIETLVDRRNPTNENRIPSTPKPRFKRLSSFWPFHFEANTKVKKDKEYKLPSPM